jgi:hypothetical protein
MEKRFKPLREQLLLHTCHSPKHCSCRTHSPLTLRPSLSTLSRPPPVGSSTEGMFFSGGSDSKLLVWHDATQSEETKRLDEAEQNLLADQQLQNDIRNKRYDKVRNCARMYYHVLPAVPPPPTHIHTCYHTLCITHILTRS